MSFKNRKDQFGISVNIIRNLSSPFFKRIYDLLKSSFQESKIPEELLISKVIPIPKCKNPGINDLRPITLQPTLMRIIDKIISFKMLKMIELEKLDETQHGFIRNKSCDTNVFSFISFIHKSLEEKKKIIVVYVDLKKAFDSICFDSLLKMLHSHGICSLFLKWIKSYLYNRKQFVEINGVASKISKITSGVPQGSVGGPKYFNITFSRIKESENCKIFKYADDMKILFSVDSEDKEKSETTMNAELDRINLELGEMNLSINMEKTFYMSIANSESYNIKINGKNIEKKTLIRDLGLFYDNYLNFDEYYKLITKKYVQRCIHISKCITSNKMKEFTYKFYARPVIEHCNGIFNPSKKLLKKKFDKIHKRFCRSIKGFQRNNLLKFEELPSFRQTYKSLILIHKDEHNVLKINPSGRSRLTSKRFIAGKFFKNLAIFRSLPNFYNNLKDKKKALLKKDDFYKYMKGEILKVNP